MQSLPQLIDSSDNPIQSSLPPGEYAASWFGYQITVSVDADSEKRYETGHGIRGMVHGIAVIDKDGFMSFKKE